MGRCGIICCVNFGGIDPAFLLISIAVLLFSLSIHESAHAWTADWLGDSTGRNLGRVTLNPLAHIDPIGSLLFPLLGLLSGGVIFGWAKPVPVNTRHLKNPKKDHVLIAAAGPVSNVTAALVFLVGLKTMILLNPSLAREGHTLYPLFLFFYLGLIINVILAVFNVIPIPPLDGSWILSGLLPENLSVLFDRIRPYGFMLLMLLLFSGALGEILGPVLGFVRGLVF